MAIFFLLIGLELKREIYNGANDKQNAARFFRVEKRFKGF
jgi:Na+/H+ antiporter NhaA